LKAACARFFVNTNVFNFFEYQGGNLDGVKRISVWNNETGYEIVRTFF